MLCVYDKIDEELQEKLKEREGGERK